MELLPTGCSMQDWTCLFSDEFSTEGMELYFSQYQHQSTPVPSTDKVCSAPRYRNIDTLGRRHEYTGGFHMRCQRQILDLCWWIHVSNAEVLQRSGLSTLVIYVIDAYISVWPCCTLGPWSTSTWCSAPDGGYLRRQKANGQLEKTAGSPSQRLAQQGSGQEDANALLLSTLWRSEIARGHGGRNGSLGLRDDDDDDDDDGRLVSKMESKINFSRHRLSGTGNIECLKITDVVCNLKQFDVEADRNAFYHFRPNENADESEIPFSAEKRKQKSPMPISQNLVTVQLRT